MNIKNVLEQIKIKRQDGQKIQKREIYRRQRVAKLN